MDKVISYYLGPSLGNYRHRSQTRLVDLLLNPFGATSGNSVINCATWALGNVCCVLQCLGHSIVKGHTHPLNLFFCSEACPPECFPIKKSQAVVQAHEFFVKLLL